MDLTEALNIEPGAIVTAVGGGGKTSTVFQLAREAAGRGRSAVATTTVKFTRPAGTSGVRVVEAADPGLVTVAAGEVVLACSGRGERGRYLGYGATAIAAIQADLLAVEGDGSAHRPFKAPGPHEPVIPPTTTDVVVCVGLDVLGKPLSDEHVHRASHVSALANEPMGAPVTGNLVAAVLLHAQGGLKGVPREARIHALLNRPETDEHRRLGDYIAARVVYGGYHTALVATAHRGELHGVIR